MLRTLLLVARLMRLVFNMAAENKIEQVVPVAPEKNVAGNRVENLSAATFEQPLTKTETLPKKDVAQEPQVATIPTPPVISQADTAQYQRVQAIENILADGLDKVFLQMNPQEQKKFKEEGEKTANKISQLLDKAKLSVDKVVTLIRRWLGLIPRVNRFFLEQEAKIKADKILKIKKSL